MSKQPKLMVLYCNDAVEVRYADGSRLHILPCATAFTYYTSQDAHPSFGLTMVQQRCRFVTSMYRDIVLSALDFRNMFAERPYICEELVPQDQVVSLYAKITEIAWPKEIFGKNIDILDDGSVRVESEDEFGSLVLSGHQQGFTVCYLSLLSHEKVRDVSKMKKMSKRDQTGSVDNKVNTNYRLHSDIGVSDTDPCPSADDKGTYKEKLKLPHLVSGPTESHFQPICIENLQGHIILGREDLNISPITQASCNDSPRALSCTMETPITPQNAVKDNDAEFRPFSTPTLGLDGQRSQECEPCGETAVRNDSKKKRELHSVKFNQDNNFEGSYIGEKHAFQRNKVVNVNHPVESNVREVNRQLAPGLDRRCMNEPQHFNNYSGSSLGDSDGSTISSDIDQSKTRCKYCWITRHISCDECPSVWSHAVKMAKHVAEQGAELLTNVTDKVRNVSSNPANAAANAAAQLCFIDRKQCVVKQLPVPLPLSCPGQLLHKVQIKPTYDDGKNPLEDPTTLSQGLLKIILIDGVVYRIVRLPTVKFVEVYPGDGSVLVSQGLRGSFYQHVIPNGKKLEMKTYSVKSPPQGKIGVHMIKSLVSRANRFLLHVFQEGNMTSTSTGLCCWKHEELTICEPLTTTLLEECEIPGYGKFTALSNGQIQIAFKDRTCLDMTCDFSARLEKCLNHSSEDIAQASLRRLANKQDGMCRLLLPNGQYQMVDVANAGIYKRYIDIAKEWADWVNSSPSQRKMFYRERADKNMNMSVEMELQKIKCFNYIVDQTIFNRQNDHTNCGATEKQELRKPGILCNSEHGAGRTKNNEQYHVQIHSPPTGFQTISGSLAHLPLPTQDQASHRINPISMSTGSNTLIARPNPIGQTSKDPIVGTETRISTLDGFNSVREALLRTSSIIKDIDSILEKR